MPTVSKGQPAASKATGAPKSPTPGTAVATQPGSGSGAVALPADLAAELAQHAKSAAAIERPNVSKMSLKGGIITYNGGVIPNNKVDVILLAAAFRNTWYSQPFQDGVLVNPDCFALMPPDKEGQAPDMVPHANVKEPVNKTCLGCPKNAWGSDPRPGSRGKACKETRRLIAIPADATASVDAIKKAELAVIDVPVTSVGNYGNYVNVLNASLARPMWTVITTLEVVRHPKFQFQVTFTPVTAINDADVIRAIMGRLDDAMRIVLTPYDEAVLQEENPKAAQAKPAKFKGK